MKKLLIAVLALVLALSFGCAEEMWQADVNGHWQGENVPEDHQLDEFDVCTVCGANVYATDREVYVSMYNDHGDLVFSRTYLADGTWVFDMQVEHEYDENGSLLSDLIYVNGELESGMIYEQAEMEDGCFIYPAKIIYFEQDGSRIVEDMSPEGELLASSKYLADDTLVYAYTCKAVYDDNWYLEAHEFYDGDQLMAERRYEYDDFGNLLVQRHYEQGRLTLELLFTVMEDDGNFISYQSAEIVYHEDGTKTTTLYDELGRVITE